MRVYLAGPIENVSSDSAHLWRHVACHKLELHNLWGTSPFRDGGETDGEKNGRLITERDRFLCKQCDMVLMRIFGSERVIGTLIELGWFDSMRKPIFVWHDGDPAITDHPMITDIAAFMSDDLDEIIAVMGEFIP